MCIYICGGWVYLMEEIILVWLAYKCHFEIGFFIKTYIRIFFEGLGDRLTQLIWVAEALCIFRTKLNCWSCSNTHISTGAQNNQLLFEVILSQNKANVSKNGGWDVCLICPHSSILCSSSKMTNTMCQKLTIAIIQKKKKRNIEIH